jgi:hypothetical protein
VLSPALRSFIRRNRTPLALLTLWAAMVALIVALSPAGRPLPITCIFRRLSGLPCPTCGSTRAVLALARLDPLEALRLNPLIASIALAIPVIALLWAWRRPRISARTATIAIVASIGANWAYLLLTRAAG